MQPTYTVKPEAYIRRGWEIFRQKTGGFVGFFLLLILINLVLGSFPEGIQPIAQIINILITGPLSAGFFIVAFKLSKNQTTAFDDFFRGFNNFLPLTLVNLLVGICTVLGTMLLIIPGIYLMIAYTFAMPFVVDKKLGAWHAMESSRQLITKQWFAFFGFVLILFLINLIGIVPLGLGLLITVPVSYCAIAAAYEDIVGLGASTLTDSAPLL